MRILSQLATPFKLVDFNLYSQPRQTSFLLKLFAIVYKYK